MDIFVSLFDIALLVAVLVHCHRDYNRSITYTILGSFPSGWEDFCCEGKLHPNFTISTRRQDILDGYSEGDTGDQLDESGFYDRVVDVPMLTDEIARKVIAYTLGVSPSAIRIEQEGFAQSV